MVSAPGMVGMPAASAPAPQSQSSTPCILEGTWSQSYTWPPSLYFSHGMLASKGLFAGKVIVWGRSASYAPPVLDVYVLDPDSPAVAAAHWRLDDTPGQATGVLTNGTPENSGHTWSQLGDAIIVGGTATPPPAGSTDTIRFRPDAPPGGEWFKEPPMVVGRFRPSATLVPPGPNQLPNEWRTFATSGVFAIFGGGNPSHNNYEVFTPHPEGGTNLGAWDPLASPGPGPTAAMDPEHPRQALHLDGLVDVVALNNQGPSSRWDPQVPNPALASPWTNSLPIQAGDFPLRRRANMVRRPLFESLVIVGGEIPGTPVNLATDTVLEGHIGLPNFVRRTETMNFARQGANAVLTPSFHLFVGGGLADSSPPPLNPVYVPEWTHLFSFQGWGVLAAQANARGPADSVQQGSPGSILLLMPDGRILDAGGATPNHAFYSPPYLTCVSLPPAPVIHGIDNPEANYGQQRKIWLLTDSADIETVYLIRPGSCTGSFDFDQRLWLTLVADRGYEPDGLSFITFDLPTNRNLVPPGYYRVWVMNHHWATGQPSLNSIVLRILP